MKTISMAMYWAEEKNYVLCTLYCMQHNCTMDEAQQALFGNVVYEWRVA